MYYVTDSKHKLMISRALSKIRNYISAILVVVIDVKNFDGSLISITLAGLTNSWSKSSLTLGLRSRQCRQDL